MANKITLPQNCHLLKLISRQLSRGENLYRWLHCPGASAGASPAFLSLSLPYALIRYTHDLTYVRARRYLHAWEFTDDVEVSRMGSRRKCKSTCRPAERELDTRDNRHSDRTTISSFILIRLKRSFRFASHAKRCARLDRGLTTRRAS